MMDLKKVRQEEKEKLTEMLRAKENELAKAYLDLVTGKLKNTSKLSLLKKEVAKLKTILREKEILQRVSEIQNG